MDQRDIRTFLHALSNSLNAVKLNAYLLKQTGGEALDTSALDGLQSALAAAERQVGDFHRRIQAEALEMGSATTTSSNQS